MLTFNLKVPFLNLSGNTSVSDGKTVTLESVLADALATKSGAISSSKAVAFAVDLVKNGTITLDETDLDALRTFIKGHENFTNLYKERLLDLLVSANAVQPATPPISLA